MSSRKMETSSHRILLAVLVVAAAAELVGHAAAATYTVGDSLGWTVPPGGPSTYESWASQYVFNVGDVLVFEFTTGAHDVAELSTVDSYTTCNSANPIASYTTGPANVVLNSTGNHYFVCTVGRHCSLGQKLTVSVTPGNSSTGPPPAPSTSPSSPPPPRSPSGSPPSLSPPALPRGPPPSLSPPALPRGPPPTLSPPTLPGGPPPPGNSAPMATIGRFNLLVVIFVSIFVAGILIV